MMITPHTTSTSLRSGSPLSWLLALCFLLGAVPAHACRYSVREVAFVKLDTQSPTLYYYPPNDRAQEAGDSPQAEFDKAFRESGVRCESVTSPQDPAHAHRGEAPLPAAVLVAPDGRTLSLKVPDTDNVAAALAQAVLGSKGQTALRAAMPEHLCAAVFVHGADPAATNRTRARLNEAIARAARRLPTLERPTEKGVQLIEIAEEDFRAERVLLWSLGIEPDALPGDPQLAAVFGHARRFGPVFRGGQIEAGRMADVFTLAGASCECGLDPSWMQGPVVPLAWPRETKARIAKALGFDPENPMVALEMRQILAQSASFTEDNETAPANVPTTGYREVSLETLLADGAEEAAQNVPPEEREEAATAQKTRPITTTTQPRESGKRSGLQGILVVLGALAGVNAAVLGVLWWRHAAYRGGA